MPSDVVIINHAHDVNEPCTSECGTPSSESVIRILDERAVGEIEARKVVDHHLENGAYIGCYILLSTSERDALCATVKHLRNKTCPDCATVADDGSGYCGTCDDFTMPSDFLLRWVRRTKLDELQSQLEQLRAENRRLSETIIKQADYRQEILKQSDFRSRAIQLCKDKAAEHLRIADVRTKNLNDAGAMLAQARSDAVNDICEELEKL